MIKSKTRKGLLIILSIIFILSVSLYAALGVENNFAFAAESESTGERVTMLDLMERYPTEFILGPIDVVGTDATTGKTDRKYINKSGVLNGKFYYKSTNYVINAATGNPEKGTAPYVKHTDATANHTYWLDKNNKQVDENGNLLTNNTHGIAPEKYFDVEAYIYTEDHKDANSKVDGRTLFGWKPGIRGQDTLDGSGNLITTTIAENGEIKDGNLNASTPSPIGIYVKWDGDAWWGSTVKYAIIVPDDVVQIGAGSGAFVGYASATATTYTSYYNSLKTDGSVDTGTSNGPTTHTSGTYAAKYTDFSCFISTGNGMGRRGEAPYFWQPRERLAGIYFTSNSNLTEIVGGSINGAISRSTVNHTNKSALQSCNSLRFCILPESLTTIGDHAFDNCTLIVDVNIPSKVTSMGDYAFQNCSSILHLTLKGSWSKKQGANVFKGCSKLKHVDNGVGYNTWPTGISRDSDLYVFGGEPVNGVNDTGKYGFLFERTSGGVWTAISLAGETGESEDVVFVFPESSDFSATSDRRMGVRYDHLDSSGNTVKNGFPTGTTNYTYTIGTSFASGVWCRNVIMPEACTAIGANAFQNSHVQYVETYATTIGEGAFATSNTSQDTSIDQWIYFHKTKNAQGGYTVSDYAASGTNGINANAFGNDVNSRTVVLEDYALYSALSSNHYNMPWPSGRVYYQIPIIVNIDNEDSNTYTLKNSDMADRFFIDSDYININTGNTELNVVSGSNSLVYTKRLSNHSFYYMKQKTGKWDDVGDDAGSPAVKQISPTLSNMDSTVWYKDTTTTSGGDTVRTYTATTTALAQYKEDATGAVNLYTKNIAIPDVLYDTVHGNLEFDYGKTYQFENNVKKTLGGINDDQVIDYLTALGLSDDYAIDFSNLKFIFADGRTNGGKPEGLLNAGTYDLSVVLNAAKWGTWSNEYITNHSSELTATATIARQVLDYSAISNIPEFVIDDGKDTPLYGNNTPIYKYGDKWYAAERVGETADGSATVTKQYVYYAENGSVKIKLKGETDIESDGTSSKLGNVLISSREGFEFSEATSHTATYKLQVKYVPDIPTIQSNYEFYYGEDYSGNLTDQTTGLTIKDRKTYTFTITKTWYIVIEMNMFVISGDPDNTAYGLSSSSTIDYNSNITVNTPALLHGASAGNISFTIDYLSTDGNTKATLTGANALVMGANGDAKNTIAYYINSSMPAGTYTLKLSGKAVTDGGKSYPAIGGTYTLVVNPLAFSKEDIDGIHSIIRGTATPDAESKTNELEKWINEYPLTAGKKKLHESIKNLTDSINGSLNQGLTGTNYWTSLDTTGKAKYFDTAITVAYNLEGSGSYDYSLEASMLNYLSSAGTYTLYYTIYAKNYVTVGGKDSDERQSRGFRVTLYTEILISEIFQKDVVTYPYFKDVTYTGDEAHTLVPTNQYFKYSFDDDDYVNARNGATVTLTLYDALLSHWSWGALNETQIEALKEYLSISEDKTKLIIKYNILPAKNDWNVEPTVAPWSYDGFDRTVNYITASLIFNVPNTQIYYRIGTKKAPRVKDGLTWITGENGWYWLDVKGGYKINSDAVTPEYFTVDENGYVSTAIEELLKLVDAGTNVYWLGCYVSPIYDEAYAEDAEKAAHINVKALVDDECSRITILPTSNRWTVTPGLTGWTYMSLTSENFYDNFHAAEAAYSGDIKYTLYAGTGTNGTVKLSWTMNDEFDMTSVISSITELDAGPYTLYVVMEGDASNYIKIDYTINFSVGTATNAWVNGKAPAISGWVYLQFKESLITSKGEANFGTSDLKYLIKEVAEDGNTLLTVEGFEDAMSYEDLIKAINKLGAGSYNLNVYVDVTGVTNYTTVEHNVRFTVSKAVNNWKEGKAPTIKGWTYGKMPAGNPYVEGEAQYGNIEYTYTYYTTITGTWLQGTKVEDISKADAGNYLLVVTVTDKDGNYNSFTYTLQFTISKQDNGWKDGNEPERILEWTWGEHEVIENFKLVGAEAVDSGKGISYVINSESGSEYGKGSITSFSELAGVLKGIGVGKYSISITVIATTNYGELNWVTAATVSPASFTVETEPSCDGWTWGDKNADKSFTGIEVSTALDIDVATVTYSINGALATDFQTMLNDLKTRGAASYTVDITVTCTNYTTITRQVTVVIAKSSFAWDKNPESESWDTDWTWGDDVKPVTEPAAHATEHSAQDAAISIEATLSYELSGKITGTYTDFASLSEDLRDANQGTYKITVKLVASANGTYDINNYNSLSHEYTVKINVAVNEWTDGKAPQESYTREYTDKPTIEAVSAKFGTVAYYKDDALSEILTNTITGAPITNVTELNAWIKAVPANDNTPYVYFTAVIDKENGNYTTLKVKTTLLITGTRSLWANQEALDASTDKPKFTYSEEISDNFDKNVVIPVGKTGESAGGRKDETTYVVTYQDLIGGGIISPDEEPATAESVMRWIKGIGKAGTYTVIATYVPGDTSYTTLVYTLILTVERATLTWTKELAESYEGDFGGMQVDDPAVDANFEVEITINVKDFNGDEVRNNEDKTLEESGLKLSEFVNTLNAVARYYTVIYSVKDNVNYKALDGKQSTLFIGLIPNAWNDTLNGPTGAEWNAGVEWTFTRGETIEVEVPTAKAGTETMTITLDNADDPLVFGANDDIKKVLNEKYLANLSAGTHTLRFYIAGTINYNELTSGCTIIVNKKDNSWDQDPPLSSYTDYGTVDTKAFTYPTAEVQQIQIAAGKTIDILRYNIEQVGGSFENGTYSKICLDLAAFKTELGKIANGTFKVTVYVGGDRYGDIGGDLKQAVDKYNEDYIDIYFECTVNLTPSANDWENKDSLIDDSWDWGSFESKYEENDLPMPRATHGNDTIVYLVRGSNIEDKTFRAEDYKDIVGEDGKTVIKTKQQQAFEAYKAFLSGRDKGTYSVTISIAATDVYQAPDNLTRVFEVYQVTTAWTDETNSAAKEYNWKYLDTANNTPVHKPEIGTKSEKQNDPWGNTVTVTLVKSGSAGYVYRGTTWADWDLMIATLNDSETCKAGTYTITVSVEEDVNHKGLEYVVTVNMSVADNEWEEHAGNGTDVAKEYEVKYGADLTFIKFKAKYNNDNLNIVVNRTGVSYDSLIEWIVGKGVGEYVIIATVPANDEYGELIDTVKIVVIKTDNEWKNGQELAIGAVSEEDEDIGWTWGDKDTDIKGKITFPVAAKGGESAFVSVEKTVDGVTSTVLEASVSYSGTGANRAYNDNDLSALALKLYALDVLKSDGKYLTYKITVTVNATDNYNAISCNTTFVIKTASNRWLNPPEVTGWSFGGDVAYPSATPEFGQGTVEFKYAYAIGDYAKKAPALNSKEWQTTLSYQAGTYWLWSHVEGTDNYEGLDDTETSFIISEGENTWVNAPGVIAWNWDGYDANINLFSGSARSNGEATFTITKTKGTKNYLTVSDFVRSSGTAYNENDIKPLQLFKYVKDSNVVSAEVAALLKALKPGTYGLTVTVAGGESLSSLTMSTEFTVGVAENSWIQTPAIRYYSYSEAGAFTAGTAKYGTVSYQITLNGENYGSVMDASTLATELKTLPVGSYVLRSWVDAASDGCYKILNNEPIVFVVSNATNSWKSTPVTTSSEYYGNIQSYNDADFDKLVGVPEANFGTVVYTIMNVDYIIIKGNLTTRTDYTNAIKELNSGEYIVRMTAQADNYAPLSADMSLKINRYKSKLVDLPGSFTGKWKLNDTQIFNTEADVKPYGYYTDDKGEDHLIEGLSFTVTYILRGVSYTEFGKLVSESIKYLSAGSYQITITLNEDNYHEALTQTVQLDIAPGDNGFTKEDEDGNPLPTPETSLVRKGGTVEESTLEWEWGEEIEWLGVTPVYGDTVEIRIVRVGDEGNVLKFFSVNVKDPSGSQKEAVSKFISSLDYGNYIMIITTPSGENWNAMEDKNASQNYRTRATDEEENTGTTRVEFSVKQTQNEWILKPMFSVTNAEGKYQWAHGTAVNALATAKYGTVIIEYYKVTQDNKGIETIERLSGFPVDVGNYRAKFFVSEPESKNYSSLGLNEDPLDFVITGARNEVFTIQPGVSDWTWNNYNRTVNLFTGRPESGGKVHFQVTGNGVDTGRFDLVALDGSTTGVFDKDIYVPENICNRLNELTAGTYTLTIYVDANGNYNGFYATTTFVVNEDPNEWLEYPQILGWPITKRDPDRNAIKARARYGIPEIVIKDKATGAIVYQALINPATGELEIIDNLNEAGLGAYEVTASVTGVVGKYKELSGRAEFEIYSQGSLDGSNYWVEQPHMEDWVADIDKIGTPTGDPVRGWPYFIFYKAVWDAETETYKEGEEIVSGPDSKLVTGNRYAKPFYVPMAPGTYLMYGCAINEDNPDDFLGKDSAERSVFTIRDRENTWEKTVNISTLMYLGERDTWGEPSAKASLWDSKVTYRYFKRSTTGAPDEDLGELISVKQITLPGNYYVIAYANATYSPEIKSQINFEVKFSKNSWKEMPTIDSWSEEFNSTSPNPEGEAEIGTIIYTYISKSDPGKEFSEKPTQAGDYILIARVMVEGYEVLEARIEFTIEPAFDLTLLMICSILAILASILLCVVIYFAVRRNREN
ncbi:MAG: leucine-rich repeat domain-containing protein [Clostridiales bacterium]|nr:leucine-rich repeat domain-containing protein [Clostridiales bacterium]